MLVSVVVAVKDDRDNLTRCLLSLREQTYPELEVIVVDNYSKDGTFETAISLADLAVQFGPERSAQRNYGIFEVASGDVIGYLDSDMIAGPHLIDGVVSEIRKGNEFVYIRERILGTRRWARIRNFERSLVQGTTIDAIRFATKGSWLRSGGFDEMLTGPEDWDLDRRLRMGVSAVTVASDFSASANWPLADYVRKGFGAANDLTAVFHDETSLSLRRLRMKKAYYFPGLNSYRSKWEDDATCQIQLSFVRRARFQFFDDNRWRVVLRHPWLFLQLVIMRSMSGGAGWLWRQRVGDKHRQTVHE